MNKGRSRIITRVLLTALLALSVQGVALSAGINVPSGSTLNLKTATLTTKGDVSFAGTITATTGGVNLTGNWTNTGLFTYATSTVTLNGTANQTIASNSQYFYNLTLNNTGTTNDDIILSAPLTVTNNLTLTDGELKGSNQSISVQGNWDASGSGSYTAGTETVTFSDESKTTTISGSNTFYGFNCSNPSKQIDFAAGTTQTITNNLALDGIATGTKIDLGSTAADSQWNINTTGATVSVDYVVVRDSNSTVLISPTNSADSGNNNNWFFSAGNVGVSGMVYTDDTASTPISDGTTIKLVVNGTGTTWSDTTVGGLYSFTGLTISAGDVLCLWIDNADPGNTVTASDGYSLSNVDIYQGNVIVRNDNGTNNATTAMLAIADNTFDTDIRFTVDASNNLLVGDGLVDVELYIPEGETFVPSGDVTVGDSGTASDMEIKGALQLNDWWDTNYEYRKRITITNNSSTEALEIGYSSYVEIDHAALVTATKAQADGDDIRIVYNGTELDRIIDDDPTSYGWNQNDTRVWFKTQGAIAASGTDNNYWVYYKNDSAANPPADGSEVYYFYDSFEGTVGSLIDSNDWAWESPANPAYDDTHVRTGSTALKLTGGDDSGGDPSHFMPGTKCVFTAWMYDEGTNYESLVGIAYWANIGIYSSGSYYKKRMGADVGGSYVDTTVLRSTGWHQFKLIADGSNTKFYIDNTLVHTHNDFPTFDRIFVGNSHVTSVIDYFDDVIVRKYITSEPSCALGGEQNDFSSWSYRKKLTFNQDLAQSAALDNFPVMVHVDSGDTDFWGTVRADGYDVRFVDADGVTNLPFHFEKFDSTGDDMIAWVKVPEIAAYDTADYIWLYYGNASASSDPQNETGTWDSNYKAVWHMSETLWDTTTDQVKDSVNVNHGTSVVDATTTPNGKIGRGGTFDGSDGYVTVDNHSSITTLDKLTISGWVYLNSKTYHNVMVAKATTFTDGYYFLVNNQNEGGKVTMNVGEGYSYLMGSVVDTGGWHYLTCTFDPSGKERLYLDGGNLTERDAPVGAIPTSTSPLNIGKSTTIYWGSNFFNGRIDELRISNTERSAQWVKASYLSGNDTLLTYGGQESVTTKDLTVKGNLITSGSLSVGGAAVAIGGDFSNSGDFYSASSTFTFNSASANQSITLDGASLYNLTINNTAAEGSNNVYLNDSLEVTNDLTITNGTLDTQDPSPSWWDASWSDRELITFTQDSQQTDPLTNFPVAVKIDPTHSNFWATVKNDGSDVRFVDLDGVTSLPFHFEKFDSTGDDMVAWVKVPEVSPYGKTDYMWVYYGNAGASDAQNEAGTWDSSYSAIWHMKEATGPTVDDSKGANNGAATGGNFAQGGIFGNAISFDGNDYITITEDSLPSSGMITVSMWLYATGQPGGSYITGGHDLDAVWMHYYVNSNANFTFGSTDRGSGRTVANSGDGTDFNDGKASNDAWSLMTAVFNADDGSLGNVYRNGVIINNFHNISSGYNDNPWELSGTNTILGRRGDTASQYFKSNPSGVGYMDEVRISNTERMGQWIKANYLVGKNNFLVFGGAGSWWNASWNYRKKLTFNQDSAQSGTLDNFPVMVHIDSNNSHFWDNVRSDGYDVRFIDNDGVTSLPFHFEKFDYSNKDMVAWVKVTQVAAVGTSDYIHLYYGNSATSTDPQNETGTWDANYKAVWHFHGDSFLDSTSNDNDGTNSGTTNRTGKIADARDFDGSNDRIEVPYKASLDISSAYTMEGWIYFDSWGSEGANSIPLYNTYNVSNATGLWVHHDASDLLPRQGGSNGTLSNYDDVLVGWTYATYTWNGTTFKAYKDGVYKDSYNPGAPSVGHAGRIGMLADRATSSDYNHNGVTDELRISNVVRSDQWIKASYLSGMDTFLTYGSHETDEASSAVNALTVKGDLSNSGTLKLNDSTVTLSGDVTISGTLTAGTSKTTFNATSAKTLTSGTQSFNNVTFNGAGATWTLADDFSASSDLTATNGTLASATYNITAGGNAIVDGATIDANSGLTVTGNLTVSGGTIDASAAGADLDIGGNVTVSSGTLSAPAATDDSFAVGGNWEVSGSGTFTHNSGNVTFDATTTGKTITTSSSGADDFYGITCNGTGGGWTLQQTMTIYNDLTVTAGELEMTSVGGGATYETPSGTESASSAYSGYPASYAHDGSTSTGWFSSDTSDPQWIWFDLGQTKTISAVKVYPWSGYDNQVANIDVSDNATDWTTVETAWIIPTGGTWNEKTFTETSGRYIRLYFSSTPSYTSVVEFQAQTSLTSTLTVNNNLTVNGGTLTASNIDLDVEGDVSISSGVLTAPSSTSFNVKGNWTKSSGTFTHSSGTVTFDAGTAGKTITAGSGPFYDITFNGAGSWTLQDTFDADNNFTITAGTVNANAQAMTIGGTWSNSGTFTHGNGTVTFNATASGKQITSGGSPFSSIVFNGVGGAWTLQDALTVTDDFTVTAGTFSHGDQTVTFTGNASSNQSVATDGQAFYDLTINNDEVGYDDVIFSGTLDVNNTLTVTDGNLDLGNNPPIYTAGDVTIASIGEITRLPGGSTWTFDGSGTNTLTDNTGGMIYRAVTVDGTSKVLNLSSSGTPTLYFSTLTIGADDTIDINGKNIDIDTALVNNGTLRLQGSETVTITGMDVDSGIVLYNGAGTYATGLAAGDAYYDLTLNGSGAWTLDAALNVDGDFVIAEGNAVNANARAINVAKNWSNSGTFTHGNNTVTLDGTSQTIYGSSTFYGLAKTVSSAATLTFEYGTTQTVSNDMNFAGTVDQLLSLVSDSAGQYAYLDTTGASVTANYLNVQDSYSMAEITPTNSTDSGNNVNWLFVTGALTISGNVYTDEGSTLMSLVDKTVKMSVNGSTTTRAVTMSSGAYTFTQVSAPIGQPIAIWLDDDASYKGATVTTSTGASIADLHIYQDHLILRDDNASTMTNTILDTADNGGDTDILYSVSAGNLTVGDTQDIELYIWTDDTFQPGGDVIVGDSDTASDIKLIGTLDADANTITAYGHWVSSAGTFTEDTSTVTLAGTSKNLTVPVGAYNNGIFNNLTVNGSYTLTTTTTLIGGDAAGGTLILGNNATLDIASGQNAYTFYGRTFTMNSGSTLGGAGAFNYCISGGTTDVTSLFTNSGNIDIATFRYRAGANGVGTFPAFNYNGNLEFESYNASANCTFKPGSGTLTVGNTLLIRGISGYTTILDNTTSNTNITAGALGVGTSGFTSRYAKLICGSATYDINGDVTVYASDASGNNEIDADTSTWTVSGNWTNNDTFTADSSTVTVDGVANSTLNPGLSSFNNLTTSGIGLNTLSTNSLSVGGNLTVSSTTSGYAKYKTITIDNTKVETTLSNFPLLVNISSDADLATSGDVTSSSGYDIIFTDASGTQLDHEIELYNASTGQFIAWVRIPTLSSINDTTIYMLYGNSSVTTSQENQNAVWDSNYKMVLHFKEGTGGNTTFYDSTSNGVNATTSNIENSAISRTGVDGKIGKCALWYGRAPGCGASDGTATTTSALALNQQDRTYEAWVKIIDKDCGGTPGTNNYYWNDSAKSKYRCAVHYNDADQWSVGFYANEGSWYESDKGSVPFNEFCHLVITHDSSYVKLYVNGDLVKSLDNVTSALSTATHAAKFDDYKYTLHGYREEYRGSNIVRSAGHIKTTYNSQNHSVASPFYSLGTEASVGTAGLDIAALDLTVAGNISVTSGMLDLSDVLCDADVAGNVAISGGTLAAPAVLDNDSFKVAGNWSVSGSGTFTPGVGRVVLDAQDSGNTIITTSSNADDFYDVDFNGAVGSKWHLLDELTATNNLTVTTGELDTSAPWWNVNYTYRKQLTVVNNSSSEELPTGYTTYIEFDHAALVTAGKSQSDGDDIRIVYNGTELDRVIDEDTTNYGWNKTTTRVWFKTQSAIAASGTDNEYYLYYKYDTAASPPANKSNVYDYYDDFADGTYDDTFQDYSGGTTAVKDMGGYTNALCSYGYTNDIHVYTTSSFSNVLFEFDYYIETDNNDGGVFFRVQDASNGYLISLDPGGAWQGYRRTAASWTGMTKYNYSTSTLVNNAWHHFKILMDGSTFTLYEDSSNLGYFTDSSYSSGYIGLRGIKASTGESCIDNILVRKYIASEPSASLGGEEDKGAWWNWSQRKKVTILGQSGAGTNYQVLLKVGESSTATGANFHVAGHCQNFPTDIRFTDNDKNTQLDYWLEKTTDSTPNRVAYFWVEVADNLDSNQDIYCYYGNADATDGSNGANTFLFFDDFEDGDISDWSAQASTVITTEQKKRGTYSVKLYDNGTALGERGEISQTGFDFQGGVLEFDAYVVDTPGLHYVVDLKASATYIYAMIAYGCTNLQYYNGTAWTDYSGGAATVTNDTWEKHSYAFDEPNNVLKATVAENYLGTGTRRDTGTIDTIIFGSGDSPNTGLFGYIDDIRLRKYAATEPTFSAAAAAESGFSSWSNRKKLTFNQDSAQSGTLENFPIMVKVTSSDTTFWNNVREDGYDVRFVDSDAFTSLTFHFEKFDYTNQEMIAWVKVPEVAAYGTTDYVWVYYGNAGASSDPQNETGVWDSNYVGVWHMGEASWNGTTNEVQNSVQNSYHGTASYDATTASAKIGKGGTFDGGNDGVQISNLSNTLSDDYTICWWIKPNSIALKEIMLLGTDYTVHDFEYYQANTVLDVRADYGSGDHLNIADTFSAGQWKFISGVGNASGTSAYVDGSFVGSTSAKKTTTAGYGLNIAAYPDGSYGLNGFIDEVRVSDTPRSAQWIKASYLTQNNTFLTYGSAEATSGNNLTVSGNLTNSDTLTLNDSTVTVGGDFTNTATVNPGTSTVVLNSASTQTLNPGLSSLYNLTNSAGTYTLTTNNLNITNDLTASGGTLDLAALDLAVSGNIAVSGGTLDLNNSNCDADVGGNVTITAGSLWAPLTGKSFTVGGNWEVSGTGTFTANSGTVTLDAPATGKTITTSSTNVDDFYDLKFNNASGGWTLQDALTADNDFTVTKSDTTGNGVDLNGKALNTTGNFTLSNGKVTAGASTVTVAGNWDSSDASGTFNYNTSTVNLTGTGSISTPEYSNRFYNLICGASGQTTTINNHFGVANVLTVGSGTLTDASLQVLYLYTLNSLSLDTNATISIGYFYFDGGINQNMPAHTYDCGIKLQSSNTTVTQTGDVVVNGDLLINGNGNAPLVNTFNTGGYALTVNGDIQVGYNTTDTDTNKTLNLSSSSVNCSGDFTVKGNMDAGTSTVVFDGAGTSTLTGDATFNNLTCTTAGKTVNFTAGTTQAVSGLLTLTGTSASAITLQSTSGGTAWNLTNTGGNSVNFVDVQDSDASSGGTINALNSTDSGNNTNWIFSPGAASGGGTSGYPSIY